MPKTSSAKKALRQNLRRRAKNLERQKKFKVTVKQLEKLIVEGKKEEASRSLSQAYKTTDKLVKVGFLNENKARRVKSRLAKKCAAMK